MSEWITHRVTGTDLKESFNEDVAEARRMYGEAGNTGTIAEFNDVILVSDEVLTAAEAETFTFTLRDPRVTGTTAGAVPIVTEGRFVLVDSFEAPLDATDFELLTAASAVAELMPCERALTFVPTWDTVLDGVRTVSGRLKTEIDVPVRLRTQTVPIEDGTRTAVSHEDTIAFIEKACDLGPDEKLVRVVNKGRIAGTPTLTWSQPEGEPVIRYVVNQLPGNRHRDFDTGFDTFEDAVAHVEALTPAELEQCSRAIRITGVVGIPGAGPAHERHITQGGGHYLATLTRDYPESVATWEATIRCDALPDWVKPTGWLVFGWADS